MTLAWISLGALLFAILLSCTTRVNIGLLAMASAWLIGTYVAPAFGQTIGIKQVVAGFPADLFLTLTGISLFFAQAQVNGTLDRVAAMALRLCRGNRGLVPLLFFLLTYMLASIGAGNIAATGLMATTAMAVAVRARLPPLLVALMVGHGALAGGMSPFAPTGIVAYKILAGMGIVGVGWRIYLNTLGASLFVAIPGYLALGGWRLLHRPSQALDGDSDWHPEATPPFERCHVTTLFLLLALVLGVVIFGLHVGLASFAAVLLLTLLRAADETEAMKAVPWGVILMVCGVTVLTSLLEKTGGLDLFTTLLARIASQKSIAGVIAGVTGIISMYSSTTGVVLPAFLPTIPGLIEKLGGGDPIAIASSMIVGGNLVDVSPLSTIGALCVAAAPAVVDRKKLFNQMLAWGLSMAVVGAIVCQILFG